MKVDKRTLREIFDRTERFEAPLFQRPYVWSRERNWEPLWEAVQKVADRHVEQKEAKPHFMGAIVLDQLPTQTGTLPTRQIIDGQQRLTTLQLALAAIRDICRSANQPDYQDQFSKLTDNRVPLSKNTDDVFKVWPTNSDRSIFSTIMSAGSSARVRQILKEAPSDKESLIPAAYLYFAEVISSWLGEPGEIDIYLSRLDTLREVFERYLTLVVIDLEGDDAQEIFETLNAGGTPLSPADLVKNFLFHRAKKEAADTEQLHRSYWEQFDTDSAFWRKEISQGRVKRPQLDWYLQYFLTLQTNDEVLATELFSAFKKHVRKEEKPTEIYLRDFKEYARIYKSFQAFPKDSAEGLFFYRLGKLETTTVFPLLLEVFKTHTSSENRDDLLWILQDLESFLISRQICQLTPKNYNRFFLDVIQKLHAQNDFSALALRSILLKENADSSKWPTNAEFAKAWLTTGFYKKLVRSRVNMILEALDGAMQSDKSEKGRNQRYSYDRTSHASRLENELAITTGS